MPKMSWHWQEPLEIRKAKAGVSKAGRFAPKNLPASAADGCLPSGAACPLLCQLLPVLIEPMSTAATCVWKELMGATAGMGGLGGGFHVFWVTNVLTSVLRNQSISQSLLPANGRRKHVA